MTIQSKEATKWSLFSVLSLLLAFITVLLMGTTPASIAYAATVEVRAAHDGTTDSPWHFGMVRFAALVDKKSGGTLKIRIFPNGQLSQNNIRTTIELLQANSVNCALFPPGAYVPFDPRFSIFDMPFLFKDRVQTFKVLDGPTGDKTLDMLAEKGIKGLAYWDHSYRQLTNSKRPIRTPEDLRGLRIRMPPGPVVSSIFKVLGATGTSTPMGELYMALQQKMVDGQENPYGTIYRRNFYEVQKYVTEWNYQFQPLFIAMNLSFFKGLSPEHQKILVAAAKEAAPYQRKLSANEDTEMKKGLVDKGMELVVLNKQQLAVFQKAMEPVYKEYEPKIGADLMKEFVNALK
jgi:TRAP-type transport system periplasmic protein